MQMINLSSATKHLRPVLSTTCLVAWALTISIGCSSHRELNSTTSEADGIKSAAATTPAAAGAIQDAHSELLEHDHAHGAVVEAPANIREFSPAESAVASAVLADKIDLRRVFEDLGPDATLWYQHVQTLANPFFGGREPGTRGDKLAAEYIEFYFKHCGLEPIFSSGSAQPDGAAPGALSYLQPFDFRSPNPDVTVLDVATSIHGEPFVDGTDFTVMANSANGKVTAPVVFVGYGIENGKDGYTSFDDETDLKGRIAMVLRYEPLDENGKSRWSTARFSRHAGIGTKLGNLAERGAAAIVLVNPPGAVDGRTGLDSLKESGRFGRRMDIPVFQFSPEAAERILMDGTHEKRDLLAWRRLADEGQIKTVALDPAVELTLLSDLEVHDRLQTQNVAAVLRGKGNTADEWIVIGAHYDHLGYGYTGTRPEHVGQLHPGADDNASGTAAMLVTAGRLAERYEAASDDQDLRSILFIAFSGEEAGLHGSKYFVENSPIGNDATTLMINMDMVGRLRSDNLLIQGMSTGENFDDILQPLFDRSGLTISITPGGSGPSDHSSFFNRDIPVLFLFTGAHDEYHKPSDQAYTVNPAGAVKVIDLLESIAYEVASLPESQRIQFAKSTEAADVHAAASGPGMGFKVSLGTSPDYTAELETGMRVDGVRPGSSAELGGIQAGDILLTWNRQEIDGPAGLAKFLGQHEPDDKVKIVLQRGDQEVTVEVTLQSRAAQ